MKNPRSIDHAQALGSNYSSLDQFERDQALRLANRVVNRNDEFSNDMAQWGHGYAFDINDSQKPDLSAATDENKPASAVKASGEKRKATESRKVTDAADLDEILTDSAPITYPSQSRIRTWLCQRHHCHGAWVYPQGVEAGLPGCPCVSEHAVGLDGWIGFWRSIRRRLIRWNFSFLLSALGR